jgi:hypothetical protein
MCELEIFTYLIRAKMEIDIIELRIKVPPAHIPTARYPRPVIEVMMLTTNAGKS